jgi:hypothetical protein
MTELKKRQARTADILVAKLRWERWLGRGLVGVFFVGFFGGLKLMVHGYQTSSLPLALAGLAITVGLFYAAKKWNGRLMDPFTMTRAPPQHNRGHEVAAAEEADKADAKSD